jgi:RND family efflux transporter MFP subunit
MNTLAELENSLSLAQVTYQKQKNLWDQGIGSEMQYLEAKNRKEALEKQINTLKSQIARYSLRSPINGTVDVLMIKQGELVNPGIPVARVVDASDIKISADVPERYIGKLNRGDSVDLSFPAINREGKGVIRAVGQVIDINNRTFKVVIDISNKEGIYKPNLLTMITAYDISRKNSIVIPTNVITQKGNRKFVYVAVPKGKDTLAAQVNIETVISDGAKTLVGSGLTSGDLLVINGFRSISEGDKLKIIESN